jgi:hypothetical protein
MSDMPHEFFDDLESFQVAVVPCELTKTAQSRRDVVPRVLTQMSEVTVEVQATGTQGRDQGVARARRAAHEGSIAAG